MFGHPGHCRLLSVAALAASFFLFLEQAACAAVVAGSLQDNSPFVVRSWQVGDGLPHNSVNAILQTGDGYLWLATNDGLARFDGVRFTVFGLREGLPSLQVLSLLEGRDGALWIGTSRGLSRLQNGRFDTWTTKDGLAGNEVTALAQDQEGSIWIGTVTGLSRWRNRHFSAFGKAEGLNDKRVRALLANSKGGVWASMFYEGLFKWDGSRFVPASQHPGVPEAPPGCLLQDRSGNLWAGTARGTIWCREDGQWRRYGPEQGLPANVVTGLIEGADGTLWAAMGGGGLYSLAKGSSPAVWQRADFPKEGIISLMEDQERNLWVGTRARGLARLKPKRVSVLPIVVGENEAVPRTLAETADGELWVGTSSRGLFRVQDGHIDRLPRNQSTRGFPYISAVLATKDGSLWCGAGPALFQWKEGSLLSAYTNEFRSWLREDRIRVLSEEQDGGIWVGTQNGQLRVLRAGQFIVLTNWQSAAPLTALLRQTDGTLLVGTYGNGVICVRDGKCFPLSIQEDQRSRFICALYEDSNKMLWIGTEGGGLIRMETGRASTLTTRNGLISDTIVQILEDNAGFLWLGSYRGILRISQQELKKFAAGETAFVHPLILGRSDGLPSEECMRGFNAGLKTRAGLLHFSTDRGIVIVTPQDQPVSAAPPAVWLEEVLVDGEVYYARIQASAQIPSPANQTSTRTEREHLTIPPGKRRLEFQYTGLRLSAPESVRFRYQLEGLDEQWIEAGRERLAFYSLLPAGKYQFHVTACDNSGVWNTQGAVLAFEVQPFFWQTWWFRLGLLAGLVASVVAVVRYVSYRRLRLRLRVLEQETAVQKDRARIAKDLHDDLGAHLSQIAMLSELAQTDFDKPAQAKGHIDLIFRTARSVTRSLDEIVWAVNPTNDSLDRFTAHLCTFAPEFLRAAGITCRLDVPMDLPSATLPSKVRHHLYLGFKEALHNVVKHASATEVWLRLRIDPNQLTVEIEDNGRGFQRGAEPASGEDGLVNLGQRMNEIGGSFQQQSEPGRGTRTVLVAPLEPEAS
jgi:ligand-binding sensor domain-containing protein/signal transduction histidine kinase